MNVVQSIAVSWVFAVTACAAPPATAVSTTTPATHASTTAPTTAPAIATTPASGIVAVGETVEWKVQATDDAALTYRVERNGAKVIASGPLPADGVIRASLDEPGTLLLDLLHTDNGKAAVLRSAGAAASPEQIKPAVEAPQDFDAFWKDQLAHLAEVPPNPQLTPAPSERAGVDYWMVSLNNVDGKHVQAQLARPVGQKKLPAMVVYQWAGVYGLQKGWVNGAAAGGWLVLNVSAHDIPIDRDAAFYEQQRNGPLKDYASIGCTSRDTSYFRTMLLADYQAIEYLTHRPDWDGKTLIVRGGSQGGFQSIAMAGLHPKVTGLSAVVPAGCDTMGQQGDRKPGWPYWFGHGDADSRVKIMETSRYFDASTFARNVTCPTLIGMGLSDTTAPPAGVFAMYNALRGPKEILIDPNAVHQSPQTKFEARQQLWLKDQLRRTGSN